MSPEWLAVIVGLITLDVVVTVAGFAYIARQVRAVSDQVRAGDAAIFPQGRRVEEVLREMRESLRR